MSGGIETASARLRAARKLIADPSKWTKGWFARDAKGVMASLDDPQAVCFCAIGAIAATSATDSETVQALTRQAMARGFASVPDFNDHETTSHADVLALFDAAIAEREETEARLARELAGELIALNAPGDP